MFCVPAISWRCLGCLHSGVVSQAALTPCPCLCARVFSFLLGVHGAGLAGPHGSSTFPGGAPRGLPRAPRPFRAPSPRLQLPLPAPLTVPVLATPAA